MGHDSRGKRFLPLKKDQIKQYDKAAQEIGNDLTELTARTFLHTGMRNGAYCHHRPSWVVDERMLGKPMIRIPERESCISGAGKTGQSNANGGNLHSRGEVCYKCRTNRDGYWTPKTSNSARPLPVMEEDLHQLLKYWFDHHEQIPLLHASAADRVQEVAEEAGFDRKVKPHDLRHTYGTMLARMGVEPIVIASVMGHGSISQTMDYITFVGRDIMQEFKTKWDFEGL